MSQQTVLDFLKKHKNESKWWTTKEMSENMGVSRGSVTNNISKLRQHNMVQFKRDKFRYTCYLYRWKEEDD